MLTDHSRRKPSKRKLALVRLGLIPSLIVLSPVAAFFRFRIRGATGFNALDARVREIWRTSPANAVALLRSTFDQLLTREAYTRLGSVEIEPFGKFEPWDLFSVQRFLYDSEVACGNLEGALAVAAALPGRLELAILQQVDCLIALGRRTEAIALLERNLDVDGWRGTLRHRLVELGGNPLRALQ